MGVELGHFALIVALVLAIAQAGFGLAGAAVGSSRHMAAARPAVAGQWVFVAMAFAVLAWAFYRNDFSVLYVAHNSNSALPAFYRFAAVWGAHEGSLAALGAGAGDLVAGRGRLQPPAAGNVRRTRARGAGGRQLGFPGSSYC